MIITEDEGGGEEGREKSFREDAGEEEEIKLGLSWQMRASN